MKITSQDVLDKWMANSPALSGSLIFQETSDALSLTQLRDYFNTNTRLFHDFYFKTKRHQPLKFFLTREALRNFSRNKKLWWFEDEIDFHPYDILVRTHCKKKLIQYEYFPFEISSHTTTMVEMIYDLILPFKYIYFHPNGLNSIACLDADQLVPFLNKTKEEIFQLKTKLM